MSEVRMKAPGVTAYLMEDKITIHFGDGPDQLEAVVPTGLAEIIDVMKMSSLDQVTVCVGKRRDDSPLRRKLYVSFSTKSIDESDWYKLDITCDQTNMLINLLDLIGFVKLLNYECLEGCIPGPNMITPAAESICEANRAAEMIRSRRRVQRFTMRLDREPEMEYVQRY